MRGNEMKQVSTHGDVKKQKKCEENPEVCWSHVLGSKNGSLLSQDLKVSSKTCWRCGFGHALICIVLRCICLYALLSLSKT